MTAELLASNLKNTQVEVAQGLSEYLRREWFEEWPMDKLILTTTHRNKYLQRKYEYFPIPGPFPENYGELQSKILRAFKQLTSDPQPNHCLVLVTHGFAVRELCQGSGLLFESQLDYCSYQVE